MRAISLFALVKAIQALSNVPADVRTGELQKLREAYGLLGKNDSPITDHYPEWRSKRKCKGKRDASLHTRSRKRKARR